MREVLALLLEPGAGELGTEFVGIETIAVD